MVVVARILDLPGGQPVNANDVRGEIEIVVEHENAPSGASIDVQLDGATVCDQTGGAPVAELATSAATVSGPARAPVEIVCSINTAEISAATGVPRFPNGPHTISARVITPNGSVVANSNLTNLIFANSNRVDIVARYSGLPDPLTNGVAWRSGNLTFTALPVLYGPGVTINNVVFAGTSVNPPHPDFGNGPGNPSNPIPTPPYAANLTAALNSNLESEITITATLRNAAGQPTAGIPVGSSVTRVDNVAPRITGYTRLGFNPVDAAGNRAHHGGEMEFVALGLVRNTGSYFLANDRVNLSQIGGGTRIPSHPPTCPNFHWHGDITIIDPFTGLVIGPFPDPEFIPGDGNPCGQGSEVNVTLPNVSFRATGNVVDPNLVYAGIRLFRSVGAGCDAGPVVDDTPLTAGTGPGQVDNPVMVAPPGSANPFLANFQMFGGASFTSTSICVRVEAWDSAVNATGSNNTTTLVVPFTVLR